MTPPTPQAEVRPASMPADDRHAAPSVVPLLRLRGHDREPVPPEACLLGPRCLVCR